MFVFKPHGFSPWTSLLRHVTAERSEAEPCSMFLPFISLFNQLPKQPCRDWTPEKPGALIDADG